MATSFTLDDIRAAAEKKYGSTDISLGDGFIVSLCNPLRLPKERRDALSRIGDRLEDENVDQVKVFEDGLRLAVLSDEAANRLISSLAGDLALLAEVFERYTKGVEMGEASASQS